MVLVLASTVTPSDYGISRTKPKRRTSARSQTSNTSYPPPTKCNVRFFFFTLLLYLAVLSEYCLQKKTRKYTAQFEQTLSRLENAENQIDDLKQQLDDALGAEDMVVQLTERTLSMADVSLLVFV